MSLIKNASPNHISLGADDRSTRVVSPGTQPIPQHLPKFFLRTRKGPTTAILCTADNLVPMFGTETIDQDAGYYNHQTRFAVGVLGEANTCMIQRIVAEDAGVRSNIALYVDVIEKELPNYVRNSLGNKVIDPDTNAYKVDATTPTIAGKEIKFVTEYRDSGNEVDLGQLTSKTGTMSYTDGQGVTTTSTMFPIMELKAKYQGDYYNNLGFSIESLYGEDLDTTISNEVKALPYKLGLYTRTNKGASPEILRSVYGEPSVQMTFKDKAKNPMTSARFDIETVFNSNWFNETDSLKPLRYEDYEGMHIYRDELALVMSGIMANEKTHINEVATTWDDGMDAATISWFDFTTADATAIDDENHLLNIFSCKSSKNVPYITVVISDETPTLTGTQVEVSISKHSPIFMNGGSDGTMNNATYEEVVVKELVKYADPDSELIDNAINVESVIYDSGFTLDTKKELANFISLRKDTAIALSSHDDALGEKDLPLSDIRAITVALKTRVKLAPESDYFGTPVTRAIIVGGTGLMRDGSSSSRIPLTYEIAVKSAAMMGASNFKWKAVNAFDHGAKAVLSVLVDASPAFIPNGIKPTLWNDGMVWAQPKDREQYFFPAVQTVYDNDTSVLNTWTTAFALTTLNKIASDAWREFTGTNTLTDAEFKDAVTAYVNTRIAGIFDGLLTVVPEVIVSGTDELSGASLRLITKLYAPNMKTTMISSTEVYRISDL